MRLTILGGGGAWPTPQQACSGYLLEHEGATVLIDPGYAVLPQLLGLHAADAVDAVLISHGHLDHCADLPALLMARATAGGCGPLPVYAPHGALADLLRAGRSRSLSRSVALTELRDGDACEVGPFHVEAALLPHHVANAGFRISAAGHVVAYTGDSGDAAERVPLARGADVLVVEATYTDVVPRHQARFLSSAAQAARLALAAQVDHTLLTHHLPGQSVAPWLAAARAEGLGSVLAAAAGMSVDLSPDRVPWARRASAMTAPTQLVPVLPRRARSDRPEPLERRRLDSGGRGLTRR
ncbi:MBL fold metallo-hydrolase [uncultured Friedmanniella sp.]|uniref:MBL fold metallo-hydrolase n=1 Tax=uncultured Friedmanniella sp. TaxID=335381 RepID=UPI0035CC62AA